MNTKNKLKVLLELLPYLNEKEREDKLIPEKDQKIYMEKASFWGVIPKTEEMRDLMELLFESKSEKPNLNYSLNSIDKGARLDITYLTKLTKIMNLFDQSCYVAAIDELPIKLENEYIKILLAPREIEQ